MLPSHNVNYLLNVTLNIYQGTIATVVQLFFAWRVKVLTGNWLAFMLIVVTAFASIGGC